MASAYEIAPVKEFGLFEITECKENDIIKYNKSHQMLLSKDNVFSKLMNSGISYDKSRDIFEEKVTNIYDRTELSFMTKKYAMDKINIIPITVASITVEEDNKNKPAYILVKYEKNKSIHDIKIDLNDSILKNKLFGDKPLETSVEVLRMFYSLSMFISGTFSNDNFKLIININPDVADKKEVVIITFETDKNNKILELENKVNLCNSFIQGALTNKFVTLNAFSFALLYEYYKKNPNTYANLLGDDCKHIDNNKKLLEHLGLQRYCSYGNTSFTIPKKTADNPLAFTLIMQYISSCGNHIRIFATGDIIKFNIINRNDLSSYPVQKLMTATEVLKFRNYSDYDKTYLGHDSMNESLFALVHRNYTVRPIVRALYE